MRACVVTLLITMMAGVVAAGDPDDLLSGRSDGIYRMLYQVREGVDGDGHSLAGSRGSGQVPPAPWWPAPPS